MAAPSTAQPVAAGARRMPLWRVLVTLLLLLLIAPMVVDIGRQIASNPALLVQQLWIGLVNGAIIAIIALGYTMVYGIIELINFAHGDVFMVGAFATLMLLSWLGVTSASQWYVLYPALAFVFFAVMGLCAALNMSIERFAYRRLRNAPRLAPLISAIGVSFILQNVGLWLGGRTVYVNDQWQLVAAVLALVVFGGVWFVMRRLTAQPAWVKRTGWTLGAVLTIATFILGHSVLQSTWPRKLGANVMGTSPSAQKSVPDLLPKAVLFTNGTINIQLRDVIVLAIALGLMLALYTFVRTTKLGKAMRATAQDRDASRLMGINVNQTITLTFLLGGALAGAAGMIAALFNGTVVFTLGFTAGLRSFTSAVLGGIGNILGAMLGGLLIGFLSALSDNYIDSRWTNAVVFAILVVILVFRPSGLLGEDVGQKA